MGWMFCMDEYYHVGLRSWDEAYSWGMEGILGLLDEFWRAARSLASGQSMTTEHDTLPVLFIGIYNGTHSWLRGCP